MKKHLILFAAVTLVLFSSCKKAIESINKRVEGSTSATTFIDHYIAKGLNSSDKNGYKAITTSELRFVAKFDNSAVYTTLDPVNQADINKLYGFSDNNQDHHVSSARIGWRWYNNQLQLFAYVYNNGVESNQLLTSVPLNQEVNCSIKTNGSTYIFTAGDAQVSLPRSATTPQAEGYLLYPYFGGDEVAPQDIHIWIKHL